MPEFLLEFYLPRTNTAGVGLSAENARRAAEQLIQEGTQVRFLRAIYVPEDEICLFLYEAASPEAVGEAARRAGLSFERIAETMAEDSGE